MNRPERTGLPQGSRNRSVPPPPSFDPTALPGNAVLTPRELAGWLRFALSTLEDWRRNDRGPPWILIAGKPRYRMGDVCEWLRAGGQVKDIGRALVGGLKKEQTVNQ